MLGQAAPAGSDGLSESAYARELLHLHQTSLIQEEVAKAKGTPAENLWQAQLDQAGYDAAVKDPANAERATREYLGALTAYLKSQQGATGGRRDLDGAWALDHAQFILAHIAQPVVTRMEYFSANPADRAVLAAPAVTADALLTAAGASLDAGMKQLEAIKPFDEKAYTRLQVAAMQARYYAAEAAYFRALAMDPAAAARKSALDQAIEGLAEWAVETPDNGVNYQSFLLRGKAELEAGDAGKALADFTRAASDKAPAWVQYQARYQGVVVHLRAKDYLEAQQALDDFKKTIPAANSEALLSADMLAYRVAWAAAQDKQDGSERRRAQRDALDILAQVMARDARFRDLVYDELAAEIPDNADVSTLFPMQQLALARVKSLNQKGDTAESRRQIALALHAAEAVRSNPLANNADRAEATFLQGVCNALLGNLEEAVQYEVEFATHAPQDPRARQVVDLALQQIGQLRQAGANGSDGGTKAEEAAHAAELRRLAGQALDLSINKFGDTQWLFAQGRLLEESEKPEEAKAVYEKIAATDRNYLDARYRLVALAAGQFGKLESQPAPADDAGRKKAQAAQKAAAAELFTAASKFMELLDHPPASAPPEVLQAAQAYRANIWLIETATALSPAVSDAPTALERLARLDAPSANLTPAQRDLVLRYRMQAYQLAGQGDKARQVLEQYTKTNAEALGSIRSLALATEAQIDQAHDPAQAKQLAGFVVMLLDTMIAQADAAGKPDSAYAYRLEQADMLTQAGQFKEAQALAVALQKDHAQDIRPFFSEARSIFAQAQDGADISLYAKAQDYFTRVLARVPPGSEMFWECWLRVMQAMEAQSTLKLPPEIKTKLMDLKSIYGTQFGGTRYRDEFGKLAGKYGVP